MARNCEYEKQLLRKELEAQLEVMDEELKLLREELVVHCEAVKQDLESLRAHRDAVVARAIYCSVKIAWCEGRNVPGLGVCQNDAEFPLTEEEFYRFLSAEDHQLGSEEANSYIE